MFAVVMILMTLLGWSSVPLFLKHFSRSIDAWTSNGWRYGFSALLWAPLLIVGVMRGSLPPGLWRAAVIPGALNCVAQVCFTWAHYKIDPGLLTFGLRLQIVFVALGAFILFPAERRIVRSNAFLLGAATVLAGTLGTILLAPEARHPDDTNAPKEYALGVSLAVGSGLLFALYALAVRRCMKGVRSATAFAAISQLTAGPMVLLMLLLGDRADPADLVGGWAAARLPANQILLLLLSAVIGIALGHVFYYAAIARLGVAISAGVVQMQPIFVTAASAFLFNETMTWAQLVCGGCAIAGAGVMLSVQHKAIAPSECETDTDIACAPAEPMAPASPPNHGGPAQTASTLSTDLK